MKRLVISRHTRLEELPEWCTVEEFGAFWGISRGKAYDLVRCGDVPSVRFGRLIRIPRSALAKLAGHEERVAS